MTKKIKLLLTENQVDVLMQAMEWAIGTVDEDFKNDAPEIYKEMKKMKKLDESIIKQVQKQNTK